MPPAVRVGDVSTHGGIIVGPGVATVLIAGQPAAVAGDLHVCPLPPVGHQPTVSPFPAGSPTVLRLAPVSSKARIGRPFSAAGTNRWPVRSLPMPGWGSR